MTRTICDLDAERALIGAGPIDASVLHSPNLAPQQFANPQLRQLWRAMLALHSEGKPLDEVTVPQRAEVAPALLGRCAITTPTAANAEHYAEIVREHALTRAVLAAAAEVLELHRRGQIAGSELLDAALKTFTAIDVGMPSQALAIGDVLSERFRELDEIARAVQDGVVRLTGVTTGIDPLDEIIGGIQPGLVTILAGRPAMGKSALALGCTAAATARGHGVHVFSLEDPRSAYADRTLAQAAAVPAEKVRACRLTRDDFSRLTIKAADLMSRKRWLYEDVSDLSAEELVRAVRRNRTRNRTELVVLAYLQLLRRPRRYESIHDAITQNLEVLARAAKHDGIAYLVLSQLSRKVEGRNDKRPALADLRESGSIEERAKCVLGMYRGSYYGDKPKAEIDYEPDERAPTAEEWERQIDILVLKNSNGRTGYVRRRWDGPTTRVL